VYSKENQDVYINLTQETFHAPDAYKPAVINVNGKKWKAVKNTLGAGFSKLLGKGLTLQVSDKAVIRKTKKLPDDAVVFTFPVIAKRPKAQKFAPNYAIAQDTSGKTAGAWLLSEKGSMSPILNGIQVGVAEGKSVDKKGFGKFTKQGIAVSPTEGTKPKKTVYFVRTAPAKSGSSYIPASKPKKVAAQGQQKQPKFKIKDKPPKEKRGVMVSPASSLLTLKKGAVLQMNDNAPQLQNAKAKIELASFKGTVSVWIAATPKKPASAKLIFERTGS